MLHLVCFCVLVLLCSASEKAVTKTPEEIFKDFCSSFNLKVGVSSDCKMGTVYVFFQFNNSEHKGCFHLFDIHLTREERTAYKFHIEYDDSKGSASHEFENVTAGVYELYIKPICTLTMCPNLQIDYGPLINMSDEYCSSGGKVLETHVQKKEVEKITVIINAVICCCLLALISGLIYLTGRINFRKARIPVTDEEKNDDPEMDKNKALAIEVYIFHYYGRNEKIQRKVEVVKDFLNKSSYFSSVKGIEEDLAFILLDVNHWLDDVLEERSKDGTVKRIILITSQEENKPDDDEIENQIFTTFIKKLNNNLERCLNGYDNLFVVQLDNSSKHSEPFKNIVQRDRYTLSGELLPDHIIDLCLNLCSGLKLDMCQVEERIRELYLQHPVRHLENCVDLAEYV